MLRLLKDTHFTLTSWNNLTWIHNASRRRSTELNTLQTTAFCH